ncbi:MAG: redox-sensitive bicupin YhaK (pirin superfamily) [Planctomycetota bacterium]|jgi:redox-sensitive bicupin YhaK (pirin superfamily)
MIKIRHSEDRGHADHGWLNARHSFSFAGYHDPEFMGFSNLVVLNQDRIAPGQGFGTHGHRDMEIVTVVLEGVLEHRDNMGNGSRIHPGEVQFMSAGSGVTHSEFNGSETEELHLLQMWVRPDREGTAPRYGEAVCPESERRGRLCLVASPTKESGYLVIGGDAHLYLGLLDGEESCSFELPERRAAWVHVACGELTLNGQRLGPGDGAAVHGEPNLVFEQGSGAEFLLWDLPEASTQ